MNAEALIKGTIKLNTPPYVPLNPVNEETIKILIFWRNHL
jgi:hypothetical protein